MIKFTGISNISAQNVHFKTKNWSDVEMKLDNKNGEDLKEYLRILKKHPLYNTNIKKDEIFLSSYQENNSNKILLNSFEVGKTKENKDILNFLHIILAKAISENDRDVIIKKFLSPKSQQLFVDREALNENIYALNKLQIETDKALFKL